MRLTPHEQDRLLISYAAATVTLPGRVTAGSTARWHLEVPGDLDLDPQPTSGRGAGTRRRLGSR